MKPLHLIWSLLLLVTLLWLGVHLALAQQQLSPTQQAVQEWQGLSGAQTALAVAATHMQAALQALIAERNELAKKLSNLDAYLRRCGDKPGCTVPIAPKK